MSIMDNYTLLKEETIHEYSTVAKFWEHRTTKAKIIMLENDDTNKVFGISFRTPVSDSTGVPHILEHSVLAGSKNYPTKEPFVDLLKGSLYTFLNAFTYPDRTCYPVASQNSKDFYNLVDVYLDAVFNPLLTEKTFQQEGWHYELKDPSDPLTIKGVVYNEMKGVYSDPDNTLMDNIMYELFKDMSYNNDSGGNPDNIPHLTYEQYKEFHDSYYHPSNSYIYFYGNDHSEARFEAIDKYLSTYEYEELSSTVTPQPQLDDIEDKEIFFDPGENERGGYVTKNWLIHDWSPLELATLNDLLLGNPEAELYKPLIESGLGEDLTPSGFETFGVQPFFMVGLKNVKPDNYTKVTGLIDSTLAQIAEKGFKPEEIEASLNSTEFHLRELNTGSYPRGLSIMTSMLTNWIYDREPLDQIRFEDDIKQLREKLDQNPHYLRDKLEDYLLDNSHNVVVKMTPQKGLLEAKDKEVEEKLTSIKSELSEEQINTIIKETKELITHQQRHDSPEDKAKIPALSKEDLVGEIEKIPNEITTYKEATILAHPLSTNGITYLKFGFDITNLTTNDYLLIPLLQRALKEFDTSNYTASELYTLFNTHTGNYHTSVNNTYTLSGDFKSYFFVSGKALPNKVGTLVELLIESLGHVKWNNKKKLTQFIKDEIVAFESAYVSSGHSMAMSQLNSQLHIPGLLNDLMGGNAQYRYLKELSKDLNDDLLTKLTEDLKKLASKIFDTYHLVANITCEEEDKIDAISHVQSFIDAFDCCQHEAFTHTIEPAQNHTAFIVPTKVNYNCLAMNIDYKYEDSILPVLKYINLDYFWNKVRVIGGAYGSRASYSRLTKTFSIFSYRDPRSSETYKDYVGVVDYLKNPISEAQLLQSITGAIGVFDSYELPSQKGANEMHRWIIGKTYEDLVSTREAILATTNKEIQAFGEALSDITHAHKATVTSQTTAKDVFGDFNCITI